MSNEQGKMQTKFIGFAYNYRLFRPFFKFLLIFFILAAGYV